MAIGLLLLAAALCLTVYNLVDDALAGMRSSDALARLAGGSGGEDGSDEGDGQSAPAVSSGEPGKETAVPDYELNPVMDMPEETIDGRSYVGVLRIPALSLELPVISEWSYPGLKIAPCRYSGSAYLGNMVIAAHNYTSHFGGLGNLAPGDEVTFTDVDGNAFSYQVAAVETLAPNAIAEMTDAGWALSLFTCTWGGQSRLTVRCVAVNEVAGAPGA